MMMSVSGGNDFIWQPQRARQRWLGAALWLVVFALALPLDAPVAIWVRDSGLAGRVKGAWFAETIKLLGWFPVTLLIAAGIGFLHKRRWTAAALIALSGAVSGINWVIKWMVGRARPFKYVGDSAPPRPWHVWPFNDGVYGLFHTPALCFPSGHATLSAATAVTLAALWPRWRWCFYAGAALVASERVAENAHYLSDVIAGAGLGALSVWVVQKWIMATPRSSETAIQSADAPACSAMAVGGTNAAVDSSASPYLSLVIPAYNEQEVVPALLQRVAGALVPMGRPFEVIVVDDGSTDQTPRLLEEGMKQYPFLRVLRMGRNGGQSAAFEAGFRAARGQVIATIDADLQNDPEEIPRLVPMLDGGHDGQRYDMITGWRKDRQDSNFRKLQTRIANRVRNWLSKETINDSASSLKLYRRECLQGMQLYAGMHRFFPTLVKLRGFKVLEVPVKHSPRFAGTAKYGLRNRALRAFIDLLAVRWMRERWLRYEVSEVKSEGARS